MALSNSGLWSRIERHAFDKAGERLSWSAKLAAEEGWSAADTRRVEREYRRFLYLAQILDLPAAPPEPIDAAWRTHLLFTRRYWEDFVPEVLPGPFHRDAATVADSAARKAFHRAIREAYPREFGDAPPRDIWVHPGRPDWGGLTAAFLILGVLGGILSFGFTFLLGWLWGIPVGGPTDTPLEKTGAALFTFCCALAFFSWFWAWIITRFQSRLRSRKRGNRCETGISVGLSYSRE